MGIIDALWRIIGVTEEPEEGGEFPVPGGFTSQGQLSGSTGANVVPLHNNSKAIKVCVSEPKRFDDAKDLADQLKNRRQVVINLENTPSDISQRIIDFLSGTVYALDGKSQQMGRGIFMFAPSNVEFNLEYKDLGKRFNLTERSVND
jgi:cell division inhibitor SepF